MSNYNSSKHKTIEEDTRVSPKLDVDIHCIYHYVYPIFIHLKVIDSLYSFHFILEYLVENIFYHSTNFQTYA